VASFQAKVSDGDLVTAGTVIATVEGDTRSILLAERSALNFISRLSGIATLTRAWVEAIKGSDTKIRDTRKTTPGLRSLEKYAVRVGGGINHRSSLSESALLKDNHIAAAGSIKEAVASIRKRFPDVEIEVEVDSLEQLEEALQAEVPLILLDNMSPEMTEKAVLINRNRAKLESSGGIRLENAREYASTGVDFLAIGALTHSAPILDISLDLLSSGEGNR
ncbi:MAG: carboxylating nicotinate-nucleotide diphosphorylase, partial [Candidatus Nanopelagicaceae bacterium]